MRWLDRHGALSILITVALSAVTMISAGSWWASKLSFQVDVLQGSIQHHDDLLAALGKTVQQNGDRLTRAEAIEENVVKIIDRLSLMDGEERGPVIPNRR